MSTKCSIIYTKENEHWFYDIANDTITIEASFKHANYDIDEDSGRISIEFDDTNCELFRMLLSMYRDRYGHKFENK